MNQYLFDQHKSNQKEIDNPNWNNETNFWEERVPEELKKLWPDLSNELKTAIYLTAKYAKDTEPQESDFF